MPAVSTLSLGDVREGRLAGGAVAAYRIDLRRGDFVQIVVEQRGADVVGTLLTPSGPRLVVDSPNGAHGSEHLCAVAAEDGDHRLEILPFGDTESGEYAVTLSALRPATDPDRMRAAACRAVGDGDAALAADTPGASARAAGVYEHALALWTVTGDTYPALVARIKLGQAWSRGGETQRAVQAWEEALAAARSMGVDGQMAPLRNSLGLAYQRLGESSPARALHEAALADARRLADLREEAVTLNNLALLAKDSGEPWRAVLLYEEALDKRRVLGDRLGQATILHNLGSLYTVLGRLPEAREALEQALRLRRAAGRRREEAATEMALAWVRCREGDFARCRQELDHSLALRREVGDTHGEAVTLDRLGSAWRDAGRPRRAVAEYERALAILRESDDRRSEGATLSNLGAALTAAGDPAKGLRHLDAALSLLERLGDPSPVAYAYLRRAKAKRALGDLHSACADAEQGLLGLESYRARAESGDLRTSYLASVHEEFEFAVDLLMELHRDEPRAGHDRAALEVVERARARGLLDLLTEARVNPAVTAALARNRELRRLEAEIRASGRRPDVASETRLRRLLFERELLLAEISRAGGAEADPVTILDSIAIQQRVLDRDTLLLVYALGERRSFVWAVTPDEVESAVLQPRADLAKAVERLHRLHAEPPRLATATQARLVATEVSRLLLGRVAHRLSDKRLAIAAEGVLARVPFAALPDPGGAGEPLVEHHEVVTLPSASVLAAIRRRVGARARAPRLLAVVADPLLDAEAAIAAAVAPTNLTSSFAAMTRAARDLGLADLRPLPFTRQEAAAIAALVPSAQTLRATGAAANRAVVEGGGLRRYRIVHLATHALLHPRHPELSGIVLSLFDGKGRPQDGFLRSYEIAGLDLRADLVVLSACRTGVGMEIRGEGLVGLTQSFFQAGAARVLASLWDVDDAATAHLMEKFYREHLVAGRPPAAALRAVQRAMRDEPRWSAPSYWAGFVVAGEWQGTQQGHGDRVSLDESVPRMKPGAAAEGDAMESENKVATREGGPEGQDGGTKGDKKLPPPKETGADSDAGGEDAQDDKGKGTKGS